MTSTETAQGSGYAEAERRRGQLIEVATLLRDIATKLGLDTLADQLTATADRVRSDALVITVLGDFNTGKSTLINALLGADALPRLPIECTAALTEVRWGDRPYALLYRRTADGVATQPEPAEVDRLADLIVVNNDDPERPNEFGRAEVYWPLELCRNNVVIVDSPGLNADPVREELTMNYLARTDAVVFVMDARANMKLNEVHFMRAHLDSHDPFFVFNFINNILPEEQKLVRDSAAVRLGKARPDHREADLRRMLWVDALAAMRGRTADDDAAWAASGVARLQQDLETFLTTERHKIKILVPAKALRSQYKLLKQSIDDQAHMHEKTMEELSRRYAEAQAPLRVEERNAARISRDLANGIGDLRDFVQQRVRTKLTAMSGEVAGWVDTSVPDNKLSIKPWKTKEQAEALVTEVATIAARRMETEFADWVTKDLQPELETRIARVAQGTDQQIADFQRSLDALRIDMTGIGEAASDSGDEDESAMSKLLAGVGGFVLAGPAAGLAGLRFGPREMAKALLPTLAIGVAWMFTPFGLPVLVAGLAAQALFGSVRTLKGLERKIKQRIGADMAREVRATAADNAAQAAAKFAAQFDDVQQAVTVALDARIATFRQTVDAVLDKKRNGDAYALAGRAELIELGKQFDESMFQLNEIIDEIAGL